MLAGCAEIVEDRQSLTTPLGIQIKQATSPPATLAEIDDYFVSTANCVDGFVSDPFFTLVLTEMNIGAAGTTSQGTTPTITIQITPDLTRDQFLQIYTHEIVHALLNVQGESADQNRNHGSIYFLACVHIY